MQEPLLETYMRVKEEGLAVMVTLSESWLRNHQVLPQEHSHTTRHSLLHRNRKSVKTERVQKSLVPDPCPFVWIRIGVFFLPSSDSDFLDPGS